MQNVPKHLEAENQWSKSNTQRMRNDFGKE
jgi:hypothetical protein